MVCGEPFFDVCKWNKKIVNTRFFTSSHGTQANRVVNQTAHPKDPLNKGHGLFIVGPA